MRNTYTVSIPVTPRVLPKVDAQKQCRMTVMPYSVSSVIILQPGSPRPTSFGYSSSVRPDSCALPRHRSDLPQVAKLRCYGVGLTNSDHVLQAHRSGHLRLASYRLMQTFGCSRDANIPSLILSLQTHRRQHAEGILDELHLP